MQLYRGHDELRPYFGAIDPGTRMRFHTLMLDERGEVGAGEYTFSVEGTPLADHGVVVVELRDDRIAFWREYQRKGQAERSEFLATEGKDWEWHIGNYP